MGRGGWEWYPGPAPARAHRPGPRHLPLQHPALPCLHYLLPTRLGSLDFHFQAFITVGSTVGPEAGSVGREVRRERAGERAAPAVELCGGAGRERGGRGTQPPRHALLLPRACHHRTAATTPGLPLTCNSHTINERTGTTYKV